MKTFLFSLILILLLPTFSCTTLFQNEITKSNVIDFNENLMNTDFFSDTDSFDLSQEIQDHDFTILNFWFPSCSPCVEEIPELNNFYIENKNTVSVLGIQLIGLDSQTEGEKFLVKYGVQYPSIAASDGKLTVTYLVNVFPTTIFINHEGEIFRTWEGIINQDDIQLVLNDQLSGDK